MDLIATLSLYFTEHRQQAEAELKQVESISGYYSALYDVFLANVKVEVRQLAIIILKNNWNKISKEEKTLIYSKLVFSESNKVLAKHLAVIIAHLSKDIKEGLLEQVMYAIQSTQDKYAPLYSLHLVIKAVSRRPLSRAYYRKIAPELFPHVSGLFYELLNEFFVSRNVETLENARLCLKTLKNLVLCFEQLTDGPLKLFNDLHLCFGKLYQIQSLSKHQAQSNMLLLICKFYLAIASNSISAFVLANGFLNIVDFFWSLLTSNLDINALDSSEEKILIQALTLFVKLQNHEQYSLSSLKNDPNIKQAQNFIDCNVFTPDFVTQCSKLILRKYLLFSQQDLTFWAEEPEGFVQEEGLDNNYNYHLRTCSEKLLAFLVSKHSAIICPMLVEMLNTAIRTITLAESDISSILQLDAIYCAIGTAGYQLLDHLDFESFLTSLSHYSTTRDTASLVIRRRLAWLIGKLLPIKISTAYRPKIYEMLANLMSKGENLVVKLTSCSALVVAIEDFDFELHTFQPYLPKFLALFVELINELEEYDSKSMILHCIGSCSEYMQSNITPFVPDIISVLTTAWSQSEEQNMFQSSIVGVVAKLVRTGHFFLLEQGLELWLSVLCNCESLSFELFQLIPLSINLLDYGSESLKTVLLILESYVLLDSVKVLEAYAVSIIEKLSLMLSNLKANAAHSLLKCLDVLIVASLSSNCFEPVSKILFNSGMIHKILNLVLEQSEINVILVGYIMVLNRLIVCQASLFLEFLNPQVLGQLLEVIFSRYDAMGQMRQRKMTGLALSCLLATQNTQVIAKIENIFIILTSLIIEIGHKNDDKESLLYTYEPELNEDESSYDSKRREYLKTQDIVYGNAKLHIKESMAKVEQNAIFRDALGKIDAEIVHQMRHVLS